MPTLVTPPLEIQPPQVPARKRWTRQECAELEALGVFKNEKLELVSGELISKMGKNRPHVNGFRIMYLWLLEAFGKQFVDAEAPIDVAPQDNPTNEPEPDIIVLNRDCATFISANPQPKDLRLVVEIADNSLNYDLTLKSQLYARAGIIEYWVVDVAAKQIYCHRQPINGAYSSVSIYNQHESMSPLSAPNSSFSPAELL